MTTQSETPRTDAFKRLAAESGLCGEEENHQTILFARTLERELAAVKEQLAEARRDAERYRYVRERGNELLQKSCSYPETKHSHYLPVTIALDVTIDAAMKEPK